MAGVFQSIFLAFVLLLAPSASAAPPFEDWVQSERTIACELMLRNISPTGTVRGIVVASPSDHDPNYFYHWVRDAALVMSTVVDLYKRAPDGNQKNQYFGLLMDYWRFSLQNQTAPALTGLGEPKFNTDGTPYSDLWGRPQNDGPALRASTLIKMAHALIASGHQALAQELYTAKLPALSVIKADLEYVSHHWRDTSYDLWEEIRGDHFYTRMVQRRALIEGAALAQTMNDHPAAQWYLQQAELIKIELLKHWDSANNVFVTTLNHNLADHPYKNNPLDAALLLGLLHGATSDGFLGVTDERVLSTVHKLIETFKNHYPINKNGAPGVAIGRYPQDMYFGGNPWVLTTHAAAEFYYKLASAVKKQGIIEITARNLEFFKAAIQGESLKKTLRIGHKILITDPTFNEVLSDLIVQGDNMLKRVQFHAPADGSLAEQIHRDNGFMTSAKDLTWNYASFLTAIWEKDFFQNGF